MNEPTDRPMASRARNRASNLKRRVKQEGKEQIEGGKRAAADQMETISLTGSIARVRSSISRNLRLRAMRRSSLKVLGTGGAATTRQRRGSLSRCSSGSYTPSRAILRGSAARSDW